MMTQAKRASRKFWPIFLVTLLAGGAISNICMVIIAVSDPSFAVEPDYYKKALNWDKEMEQQRQNAKLGWKVALQANALKAPAKTADKKAKAGVMQVALKVQTPSGLALKGAKVKLVAYHNARAAMLFSRKGATKASDGQYAATIPLTRWGVWVFRLSVRKGDKLFTHVIRRHIKQGQRPSAS